jgi:hypothetical protein
MISPGWLGEAVLDWRSSRDTQLAQAMLPCASLKNRTV